MKKLITAIIISISIITTTAFAQDTFKEGSVTISLTFGPPYKYSRTDPTGLGFATALEGQYGIKQVGPGVISAGALLGFSAYNNNYYYGSSIYYYDQTISNFFIAAHGDYHYDWKVKKLDTYAGIAPGVRLENITYNDYYGVSQTQKSTKVYFGSYAGASYYFKPSFGVNAEVGLGLSVFRIGILVKFGGGSDK